MALDAFNNKKTDPEGDVDEQSDTQAHLSDFDIDGPEVGVDGARLKPKHIAFLNSLIEKIKSAPGQRFTVAIGGTTDTLNRSGAFNNQALSERRARAVETFLRQRLPPGARVTFDLQGFGPVRELLPNTPDAFSRAVDVALLGFGDPKPERPRGPSPGGPAGGRSVPRAQGRGGFVFGCVREFELPTSQVFKIRIENLQILTVSSVVSTVSIRFQIVDDNGLGVEYGFSGENQFSLGQPDLLVIRDKTGFRSFQTLAATRVTDFQSAVVQTGTSPENPLGPLPRPRITLTFRDKDGIAKQAQSELDMSNKEGSLSRRISGNLTMNSTCRGARGALEVDRTNIFS